MQGIGNDFVVIDAYSKPIALTPAQLRLLADRHFGVGCDQVLLIEKPRQAKIDFRYRIFNADGGEVNQCGNGARCFARFVRDRGLTNKDTIIVETSHCTLSLTIETDGQVTVNMRPPEFTPSKIPFAASQQDLFYPLDVEGKIVEIGAVSMGNPHAVVKVDNVDDAPVTTLGALIEKHERFPEHVNVGFMQLISRDHIRLRVFERGVGETLACGTGACAAVAIARQRDWVSDKVCVELRGGQLSIRWLGANEPVWMTGPANTVFEGTIEL